jgi:hypothetical protein
VAVSRPAKEWTTYLDGNVSAAKSKPVTWTMRTHPHSQQDLPPMQETNMPSRMPKLILLLTAMGIAGGICHAASTNGDYSKFKQAVLDGKDIRMTLDLSKCLVHGTDKSGPSIQGSLHFDGYMVEEDQSIAFAMTHFTIRPNKMPVDEFLSFRVLPTGAIDVHTSFLNAATYAVFQEAEFDCNIDKGVSFHW